MASATARRSRGDPDEDIAAIAKQISDQAEAIYQNWKSRGLGPADLISCHAVGDTSKLGSMLKPQPPSKPTIELLAHAPTMDNNRLEKLVKNFVVEDKARMAAAAAAAARNNKPMPSSIQYALQKFEKNAAQPGSGGGGSSTTSTTNNNTAVENGDGGGGATAVRGRTTRGFPEGKGSVGGDGRNGFTPAQTSPLGPKPAIGQKPQILGPKPRLQHHHHPHYHQHLPSSGDTIEMTLPGDTNTSSLSPSSTLSTSSSSSVPGSPLQTWPLKNRRISTDNVKKTVAETGTTGGGGGGGGAVSPSGGNSPRNSTHIIDEVDLEEKRLINALKNGGSVTGDEFDGVVVKKSISAVPTTTITQLDTPTKPTAARETISTKWGVRSAARRTAAAFEQPLTAPSQQATGVPHPELTTSQRLHLRQSAANPVRPFLTRGSVAERVLIFERCPSDLLLDKRVRTPVIQPSKPHILPKQNLTTTTLPHTTLQRHVRAHRTNVHIPRFHFPTGKPPALCVSSTTNTPTSTTAAADAVAELEARVTAAYAEIASGGGADAVRASREHFGGLVSAVRLPLYWKTSLCLAACADKGGCSKEQFLTFWNSMTATCHDAPSRFVYILTRGRRNWLSPEDLIPLVQDVVESHPGLTFLKEATEFHSRYVHTVIARIFYCVNRSWSGRITIPELRRSNLLSIIQILEEEEDINQVTQYFSYEHFYVIYCKFWELDRDHDLYIDKQDMTRHNDHALSKRIIERIFSGCVTRGQRKSPHDEKLSYCEFVWFLLSEEDKRHPTAIEYWFRCMDMDGDGYLSMYELEYFYEEQMHRMEMIGIETLPFEDCLCQMLDMVKPAVPGKIALSDLKKCKMTPIFFDTFFNLEKYMDHEQRDPFASQRDHDIDGQELSDWDKYAAEEYELLVAEEGGTDDPNSLSFDEGNEDDDDLLSQNLDVVLDITDGQCVGGGSGGGLSDDDSDECSI